MPKPEPHFDDKKLQEIIVDLLNEFPIDTKNDCIQDTPKRAAKSYKRLLCGYGRKFEDEITVFENEDKYDNIIYSGKIDFFSTCEHHLLPFFGTAHVGYIPDKKIIGLSKMSRAVEIFSRRLQNQERITIQVADAFEKFLKPRGVIVFLEGKHLCSMARGVEQVNSNMKTIIARGDFEKDESLYERFFSMIGDT